MKKNEIQQTEISIKINTKETRSLVEKSPLYSAESFSSEESRKSPSPSVTNNFSSSSNDADNEANSSTSCNSNKQESPIERNSDRLIYGNLSRVAFISNIKICFWIILF